MCFAVGQLFADGKIDVDMKSRLKDAVISGRNIQVNLPQLVQVFNTCTDCPARGVVPLCLV